MFVWLVDGNLIWGRNIRARRGNRKEVKGREGRKWKGKSVIWKA